MNTVVSLKLQSGETFDSVPLGDLNRTLGEFLNEALLTLEVGLYELLVHSAHIFIGRADTGVHVELLNKEVIANWKA